MVFLKGDHNPGCYNACKHCIGTGDARPIVQPMRHTPLAFEAKEEKYLNQMLRNVVIHLSCSNWNSASVPKSDGTVHYSCYCVDYRAVNATTKNDVFSYTLYLV